MKKIWFYVQGFFCFLYVFTWYRFDMDKVEKYLDREKKRVDAEYDLLNAVAAQVKKESGL